MATITPGSGEFYFYHPATGEVSFLNPAANEAKGQDERQGETPQAGCSLEALARRWRSAAWKAGLEGLLKRRRHTSRQLALSQAKAKLHLLQASCARN